MENVVVIEAVPSCTLCGSELDEMLLGSGDLTLSCVSCGWRPMVGRGECACMASVIPSDGTDTAMLISLSRECLFHRDVLSELLGRGGGFRRSVEALLSEERRRESSRLSFLRVPVGKFGKKDA